MEPENIFLTKSALLKGTDDVQDVDTCMGTFQIRPLTVGEKARTDALLIAKLQAKGNMADMSKMSIEGDASQIAINQNERSFHTVACGLSVKGGDKFTSEEVKRIKFKGDSFKVLLEKIQEISDMLAPEERASQYFSDGGGKGDGDTDNSSST